MRSSNVLEVTCSFFEFSEFSVWFEPRNFWFSGFRKSDKFCKFDKFDKFDKFGELSVSVLVG